ncbi:SLC13 family permease [Paenibacillus eucommiae]|uniref:Sodium-dependent dicarboxylate transporter SdcS n=1 Tax=Paenibacillus eucommiae TaxID=1355755 RepID=A0ABS4IVE5_9BACL|nr:SLC13 family permease [Paenibacillus eucommiae]MBP1991483.1 di/tricarboxylate transporter/CRP-like cAMP-binding protein [Paenibacillus eucommiae]
MTLKNIEMFEGLSNIELAKLLGRLDKLYLASQTVLFAQGDVGDRMYIIKSGSIELFSNAAEATRQSLAVLDEGDAFGEMALLSGDARSAAAVAAMDTVLYVIDRDTFDNLIAEQASISSYFIRLLSKRLVVNNERLQASKQTEAQLVLRDTEQFPEYVLDLLLWCAELPRVSKQLVAHTFTFSLQEELEANPGLQPFLQVETENSDWFTLKPSVRRILSDISADKLGYAEKKLWAERAAAYYEAQGQWVASVEIHAERKEWEAVFETVERSADQASNEQNEGICQILTRCPEPLLITRYTVLEKYIEWCTHHAPETGLSLVEIALEKQHTSFTSQQIMSIYEWGAKLCQLLDRKQQALEYLQQAEALILLTERKGKQAEDQERSYELAKQKFSSQKSRFLAERASRLMKRSRLMGLLLVIAAIACVVIFHYIPPIAGLSRHGMDFTGIALAAVILWIVNIIPDYVVALGMVMLWVMGGLVQPEVALSGFASTTWLFMIFIMAFSAVITRSGILYRFSLNALRRFPPNYRGQLWGIMVGGVIMNPMIPSSSAKVSLGVPIAQTLAEAMGFAERSRGAAGLGLAAMLFYGFMAPFVMTGSYTNIMAYGFVSAEHPVSWLQWFLYALPGFFIFIAVFMLMLLRMRTPSSEVKVISGEVLDEQLRLLGPMSKEEIISLTTVIGCIILMILQPLHGIDSTWVMLLGFSVLVISRVLNTETIRTGIDWTFLLFLGVAFSFAAVARELGIVEAMSSFLGEHMTLFISSPTLFLLAVILLSFLVTFVVRDDPAVILLVTALLPLGSQAGIHPWILVFIILLSTDPFIFSYQSPTYLTAYYSSEGKAFSHRQGQKVAFLYVLAVLLVGVACVPYWKWLGLIQ